MMIALDSNAMTYWIDAMSSALGPPQEPCADEKVALARIFFWMPAGSCFRYPPSVEGEYRAIKDRAKRDNHLSWAMCLISPVWPLPDPAEVEARAAELRTHHSGEQDVRIVAECELGEMDTLLTCDTRLLARLEGRTTISIRLPSEYWKHLAVPRGVKPSQDPAPANPMSAYSWWHWQRYVLTASRRPDMGFVHTHPRPSHN